MTGTRRFLLIAIGVCAGAGCLFPSLDDLSGDDASKGNDASDVVTTSDVTSPSDGGDASDAPKGRFCEGVDATFCEDFDEPDGNYLSRWTSFDLGGGNTLALETDATTSAPNALYAEIPANLTGGASVALDLAPNLTQYDYSFAVRLEPYDAGAGLVLFNQIEVDAIDAAAAYTEYRLAQAAVGTTFHTHVYFPDGGSVISNLPLTTSFVPGQWYHVDVQLTVAPPPAKVTITVDGAPALAATIPEATNGAGTSWFLAGISHTYAPTGTWRVEVDDVIMRAK